MPKKLHPADAADRAKISTATHFNVHLRRGPSFKVNEQAPTLATAIAVAERIAGEYGKRPLIYAVTPEGASVFVPSDMALDARPDALEAQPVAQASRQMQPRKPDRRRPAGRRAAILEAARSGTLPEAPDFSAATHARFRDKLAKLVAMAKAGDIDGLRATQINPVSSSPKAMQKYRDLCVIALNACVVDR